MKKVPVSLGASVEYSSRYDIGLFSHKFIKSLDYI